MFAGVFSSISAKRFSNIIKPSPFCGRISVASDTISFTLARVYYFIFIQSQHRYTQNRAVAIFGGEMETRIRHLCTALLPAALGCLQYARSKSSANRGVRLRLAKKPAWFDIWRGVRTYPSDHILALVREKCACGGGERRAGGSKKQRMWVGAYFEI